MDLYGWESGSSGYPKSAKKRGAESFSLIVRAHAVRRRVCFFPIIKRINPAGTVQVLPSDSRTTTTKSGLDWEHAVTTTFESPSK